MDNFDFEWDEIVSIEEVDEGECYDITLFEDDVYIDEPNFIADGIVVHNCGMDARYCKRKQGEEPYNIHPIMEPILGVTYGIMCIHANTYVSMADGREIPIKYVRQGDRVHSVNLESKKVQVKECHGCGPTKMENGYVVTLSNGLSVCLTKDHEVLTWDGMKEVQNLDLVRDVIACPNEIPPEITHKNNIQLAEWLGDNESVAYLLGQLVGNGCMTSSGVSLCVGSKEACDLVEEWITSNFSSLNVSPYFHCRSWYLSLSHKDLVNSSDYGNRKTKFSKLLEDLDMKNISWHKRVPEIIMMSPEKVRLSFLAGLFDSDGHAPNKEDQTCHITSVSEDLLNDVRKLLLMQGIICSLSDVRILIWNQLKFRDFVGHRLVVKSLDNVSLCGATVGDVPREVIRSLWQESGISQREFAKKFKVSRGILREGRAFANSCTYEAVGGELGDLRYYSIKSIEVIPNQRFYAMSVADNHNLIANGIVIKNCYQEQVMEILRVVGGIPDMHTEKVRKAISKKDAKVFGKYKLMFLDNGQKKLECGRQMVIDLWDQIESFAEYGFNKSHSYAYTYISSRLLYLKAHYPTEFYTAILMCEEDHEKFKQYKLDAKYHGVDVKPVHINKSKGNFAIGDDNEIFFGFKNIKGIGTNVADVLVDHQPYKGYMDFLERFGTDDRINQTSTAVKAMTAIGCFDEAEEYGRSTLKKFADFHKDTLKKRRDRQKRFEDSMLKKNIDLEDLLLSEITRLDPDFERMAKFDDEARAIWEQRFSGSMREVEYKSKGEIKTKEVTFLSLIQKIDSKRESSQRNFEEKERQADEEPITLDEFNPTIVKLDEKDVKLFTDVRVLGEHKSYPEAERTYYGFEWIHELETSPDYTGLTIDKFLNSTNGDSGPVEVRLNAIRKRTSKRGTEFFSVDIEDANGKNMVVNIWMDDYLRFKDMLVKDNLVCMRVKPPSGGFNTLTFESVPKHKRKDLPPPDLDYRMRMMKKPEAILEEAVDLSDLSFEEVDI